MNEIEHSILLDLLFIEMHYFHIFFWLQNITHTFADFNYFIFVHCFYVYYFISINLSSYQEALNKMAFVVFCCIRAVYLIRCKKHIQGI